MEKSKKTTNLRRRVITPEGEAPMRIGKGDIVELVGGTNGRLVGKAGGGRERS